MTYVIATVASRNGSGFRPGAATVLPPQADEFRRELENAQADEEGGRGGGSEGSALLHLRRGTSGVRRPRANQRAEVVPGSASGRRTRRRDPPARPGHVWRRNRGGSSEKGHRNPRATGCWKRSHQRDARDRKTGDDRHSR